MDRDFLKFLLIFPAFFLIGCTDIRPLYDTPANKSGLYEIEVNTIAERDGQKLRAYLQDTMKDIGLLFPKPYTMSIKLSGKEKQFAFTQDGNASREVFSYTADVTLIDSSKKVVLHKIVESSTEYNVSHTQGTIMLSLYGRNSDALIKELGDKIIENLRMNL